MNKNILLDCCFSWCRCLAGSFIVVEIATNEMDPIDLGFLRFLVATPLMVLLVLLRKTPLRVPLKEIPWLVVLG